MLPWTVERVSVGRIGVERDDYRMGCGDGYYGVVNFHKIKKNCQTSGQG